MGKEMIKYTESGLWVEKHENHYTIGLSAKGQDDLGDVSFIELSDNTKISSTEVLFNVEAAKAVTSFVAPFDATVVKWHKEIEDQPVLLNSTNKQENWIVEVTGVDGAIFNTLFDKDLLECTQCSEKK